MDENENKKNEPNIIRGRVVSTDGHPILAVTIYLSNNNFHYGPFQTNEFGDFAFPQLQNGTYTISFTDKYNRGILPKQDTVQLKGKWEPLRTVILPYEETKKHTEHQNEIFGNILDETGVPIVNASLVVRGPVTFGLRIDRATGAFSQQNLPNGNYVISAQSPEYIIADTPIQLTGNRTAPLTIIGSKKLRSPRFGGAKESGIYITGHIYDASTGKKEKGIDKIQIFIEGANKTRIIKHTGTDGKFTSPDLSGDIQKIREQDPDAVIFYTLIFRDIKKRYSFSPVRVLIPSKGSPKPLVIRPHIQGNSISGFAIGRGEKNGKLLSSIQITIEGVVAGIAQKLDTLRTNQLGFFSTAGKPYFTGHYTISALDPQGKFSFDTTTVQLEGRPAHVVLIGTPIEDEEEEDNEEQEEEQEQDNEDEEEGEEAQKQNRRLEKRLEEEEEFLSEEGEAGETLTNEDIAYADEGQFFSRPTEEGARFIDRPPSPEPVGHVNQINPEMFSGMSHVGEAASGVGEAATGAAEAATEGLADAAAGIAEGATGAAEAAVEAATGAAEAAAGAAEGGATAAAGLLSNPVGWAIIAIIIVVIIVVIILLLRHPSTGQVPPQVGNKPTFSGGASQSIPEFTIQKAVDLTHVENSFVDQQKTITYTLTVHNGRNLDVTVTDSLPSDLAKIVDASPKGTLQTDSQISWKLLTLGKGPGYTLTFKVQPLKHDSVITNKATATAPGAPSAGGSIAACMFYRAYGNPGAQYKSQKLLSAFQEAESLSGVPASLLAAIAKVESNATDYTDDSLSKNSCPGSAPGTVRNGAGAIGLMQLVDKSNPSSHDAAGIALGAKFLGKDYNSLGDADYCDPRESIIMAAGFVIDKMHYSYPGTCAFPDVPLGDGKTWNAAWTTNQNAIRKAACIYYGSLAYTGGDYGDDLWNSVSQCKVAPAANQGPLPPEKVAEAYNITLKGFSSGEEQLVRKALSGISGTNLLPLVAGTIIERGLASDPGTLGGAVNYTIGCAGPGKPADVHLVSFNTETILHELGHVVAMCNPDTVTYYHTDFEKANSDEKGVSDYARNVGSGAGVCPVIKGANVPSIKQELQLSEDYAESTGYYLTPGAADSGICTGAGGPNPFSTTHYPEHKAVVQKVYGSYP